MEDISIGSDKLVKVTGVATKGKTVTVLCRGSNKLIVEEAERSIHDALCVSGPPCCCCRCWCCDPSESPAASTALLLRIYLCSAS